MHLCIPIIIIIINSDIVGAFVFPWNGRDKLKPIWLLAEMGLCRHPWVLLAENCSRDLHGSRFCQHSSAETCLLSAVGI